MLGLKQYYRKPEQLFFEAFKVELQIYMCQTF